MTVGTPIQEQAGGRPNDAAKILKLFYNMTPRAREEFKVGLASGSIISTEDGVPLAQAFGALSAKMTRDELFERETPENSTSKSIDGDER